MMNLKTKPLLTLICFVLSFSLHADNFLETRVEIGINLLPAVIAANENLKQYDDTKEITVFIVYEHDKAKADIASKKLQLVPKIRNKLLIVKATKIQQLLHTQLGPLDVIFIVEKMKPHLITLKNVSVKQKVILFSPYKGDVKGGVLSGIDITNKVLPSINIKAMSEAGIDMKTFFLRIAVTYD